MGDLLAAEIKAKTDIKRVRADTFGYLQRCYPSVISTNDAREAAFVGSTAVKQALKLQSGSVAIRRKPGKKYQVYFEAVPLSSVAKETKHMPDEFINSEGNDVTKAFIDYAKPIVGELPVIGRFAGKKIAKK